MTASEKFEEIFSLEKGICYHYHLLCALECVGRENSSDFLNTVKALKSKTEKENKIFRSLTNSERNYLRKYLNNKNSVNKNSQNSFSILTVNRLKRRLNEISERKSSTETYCPVKKANLEIMAAFADNFLKLTDDDIANGIQSEHLGMQIYRKYAFIYDNLMVVERNLIKRNFASHSTFQINDIVKKANEESNNEEFLTYSTINIAYEAVKLLIDFSQNLGTDKDKSINMIELRTNFNQIRGYLMLLSDNDFKYFYDHYLSVEEVSENLKIFDSNALQIILEDREDSKRAKALKKSKNN